MDSEAQIPRGFPLFMPFLLGFASPQQDGEGEEQGSTRVVLINPLTASMVVLGAVGDGSGLPAKEGPPPASRAAVEALPAVTAGEEPSECAVCLEEWETGKEMPCGHRFHGECIERWLGIHGTCPVCRFRMPAEEAAEKKREEGRGGEGGIWISFSINFGSRGAEDSNDNRSDSFSSDSASRSVHETES